MFKFLITLLIFGKGQINDNWHVRSGKDTNIKKKSISISVEYETDF